ncbi:12887_t:CDS:2 [Entrophospora sp. SA101]|nr:2211_t:CDS:2 [Entrophospora sp. SA101]CAJ0830398.1 12887_t:CDS:2 [Entrophospora sp. SA101]
MNSDISNSTGSVGRRFTEVWEHVTKGREISRGHYEGTFRDRKMVDVFKKGKVHPEVNPPISKKLVKCENLENDLRKFLQCSLNSRYFLILGKLGTGKTTLIQSTILNLQEPKQFMLTKAPSAVEQDNHSEYSNWNLLSIQLLDTTYNYMKKYKHPMVLILDQVDRIVMNDQKFIEILQDFAKDCADESSLIVVFIASEGLVPQIMRSRSSRESDKGLDLIDSEELELDESDTGSSSGKPRLYLILSLSSNSTPLGRE